MVSSPRAGGKNNSLCLKNPTVVGLLTLRIQVLIWLQPVSDVLDMNHLRLVAIGEFQVARSLSLVTVHFPSQCGCSFLDVGVDNRTPTLKKRETV